MKIVVMQIFLVVLATVSVLPFSAQENIKFSKLSVKEGLSQSSVTCMLQDKKGFLWFGTMDGLNRYDGYSFKTYYSESRDSNSLGESWINSLTEDENGNLWIGTKQGGLNLFNPVTEKFTCYLNNLLNPNSLSNNIVNCILNDGSGKIWIGTSKGLNRFDYKSNKFERFFSFENNQKSLTNNFVNCLFKDSENNIWVGTDNGGLNKYNKKENNFTRFQYDEGQSKVKIVSSITDYKESILVLSTNNGVRFFDNVLNKFVDLKNASDTLKNHSIRTIFKNSNNEYWCGLSFSDNEDVLVKFNLSSGEESKYFPDQNNPDAISNENIQTILKDKAGVIWIGMNGKGLNYFNPNSLKFNYLKRNDLNPNGLSNDYVYSAFEDKDNSIWIGTSNGGFNHYIPSTGKMQYIQNDFIADQRITSICEDNDKFWLGGNTRQASCFLVFDKKTQNIQKFIVKPDDENFINDDHVNIIFKDDAIIWIGTAKGGLNKYDPSTKKFKHYIHNDADYNSIIGNEVSDIFKDKTGKLWVATKQGLSVFNKKTETFSHYLYDPKNSNSMSNNSVLCVTQDIEDNMWIGTAMGLNKFNPKTGQFKCFTIKNGLPNNYIYGLLEDSKGCLWISTNNGLSKYNPKNETFKHFGISDGLQSKEFNTHAFHKGKSGNFYFGGINGLNWFFPDSIKDSQIMPTTLITSFKIFGKEIESDTSISYRKNIKIDYNQNFLSFDFASVDYLHSDKNEFSCKMEGFDKDWIYLGYNHNVSYSNLDPGDYIFRVKSTNNDGVWNLDGTYVYISILPPFYKTKWFYVLCVFLILILIYVLYKQRIKKFIETQQILEIQVKERTKEIENQKDELEVKSKDITDSINYAKRIQTAMLTSTAYLRKNLPDHFVLFKPKDVISGDFYWSTNTPTGKVYVVIADCTGHGVPGAFMSLIGISKLNEIVLEKKISDPAKILNQLRDDIINSLNPEGSEIESYDGMDIVICCYDFKNMILEFACANNPLWILRNEELIEFKPDKMPVGKYHGEYKSFTLQTFKLEKGDIIYSFTDGYADQFGGPKGKKFKYKQIQELLLSNNRKPLNMQKEIMTMSLESWKGTLEQVDDILLLGVKI